MKKLQLITGFLLTAMVFTSCFDLIEEVHYKKDGSGTYKFTMDMSGLKGLMELAMSADTTGEFKMDTLSAVSKELSAKVRDLDGITNIREITDSENLVFGVEFDFRDVKALNLAMKEGFSDDELSSTTEKSFFQASKKSFQRIDARGFGGMLDQMLSSGLGGEDEMDMAQMFLKDVSYTMIYHFDRKVKKVSNNLATVSDDKKTVTLKYFLFDDTRGGKTGSIENTIKLK